MCERYTIRVGPGLSFVAYKLNAELFVPSDGLYSVFQFDTQPGFRGFLSRSKIATVENEDLKAELGMKGNVRFLSGDSVKQLIKLRLASANLETALADYKNAVAGVAVDLVPLVAQGAPPPVLALPPIPVQADATALVIPRLTLPHGDSWWESDDFLVGKKFAFPEFDHGADLKDDFEAFRAYWSAKDSAGREGDALASATLEKRVSRIRLYLGFLDVVKAVQDPKILRLSACLDHQAVAKYVEVSCW